MSKKRKRGKLTDEQRTKKAERNERRKRDSEAVRWTKAHVVKEKTSPYGDPAQYKSKAHHAAIAFAQGLKDTVPGIEDARSS